MANNPPSYVRTVGLAESALVDDVERPCELRVDGSMAGVSKEVEDLAVGYMQSISRYRESMAAGINQLDPKKLLQRLILRSVC
jgi:hypothetical protein